MKNTRAVIRRPYPAPPVSLGVVAEALAPGMAQVLERLVAGYLTGTRPQFTCMEEILLRSAGAALSIVNRTPGSAQQIGRDAARAVSHNPEALRLAAAMSGTPKRIGVA